MAKKQKKVKQKFDNGTHEHWLEVKAQVFKSPYFWVAVVLGAAFLAVSLWAIVEASMRYQGFYDAGNAFNAAWEKAHNDHAVWFKVVYNNKTLTYWTTTNPVIYTGIPTSVIATKTFSQIVDGQTHTITYYETQYFRTADWHSEIEVVDNEIWAWLAQPLFGKNVFMPDVYKSLVDFRSFDKPDLGENLSFFAALWPNSMNMNYGYWIITGFFLTGFMICACMFSWFMIKLSKNYVSKKSTKEHPGFEYLEDEADNVHEELETAIHKEEDQKDSNMPSNTLNVNPSVS